MYLTDSSGERWRAHDVRFGPPRHPPFAWSKQPPPDPAANYRAFVNAAGQRRIVALGEDRGTDEATLRTQLARAEVWEPRHPAELVPGYAPTGPASG